MLPSYPVAILFSKLNLMFSECFDTTHIHVFNIEMHIFQGERTDALASQQNRWSPAAMPFWSKSCKRTEIKVPQCWVIRKLLTADQIGLGSYPTQN